MERRGSFIENIFEGGSCGEEGWTRDASRGGLLC